MKKTISFHPPIIQSTAIKANSKLFERSIEAFENKQHQTSLKHLLASIDPDIRKRQAQQKTMEYHIQHGPLNIQLAIDDEKLNITVPLVTLPEKEIIPLLRQVAAFNFNDLDLTQLVRRENGLYFNFSSPLLYCHPRKIQRILEEICRTGVKYDYDFHDQFQVERLSPPHFKPYSPQKVDYISEVIQASCRECLQGVEYFGTLRQYNDMWLIIRTAFLKILYVANPQGKFRHTLEKAIGDMDRDLSLNELVADGKRSIEQLLAMTKEELSQDLYYTEIFIPDRKRSNLQNLRENYESCYKQVSALMESGEYRKVCLKIIHKLYDTYYLNSMDDDLNALFVEVLRKTSVQPWAIAAPVLYQFFDNIMQGRIKRNISPVAA